MTKEKYTVPCDRAKRVSPKVPGDFAPVDNGRPGVGIGVIVVKDGKILIGRRLGSYDKGTWHFPGGKLEFGESFEECAKRETFEETGIRIKNIQFVTVTNDLFRKDGKHYVTIYLKAGYASGTVSDREPEKDADWKWVAWDKMPKPLFTPTKNLLKTGYRL